MKKFISVLVLFFPLMAAAQTETPTDTPVPATSTPTHTLTNTPTTIPTATQTPTITVFQSPTRTATRTRTATATATNTRTHTPTPTITKTPSITPTVTITPARGSKGQASHVHALELSIYDGDTDLPQFSDICLASPAYVPKEFRPDACRCVLYVKRQGGVISLNVRCPDGTIKEVTTIP